MPKKQYDFSRLEELINDSLRSRFISLIESEEKMAQYSAKFDRSMENGFYGKTNAVRALGEKPTWAPNPAYMDSLEDLWTECETILLDWGLKLNSTLRQGFFESTEYKDRFFDHRRVFTGQLVELETGHPVTFYAITIPHSHKCFQYLVAPTAYISRSLASTTLEEGSAEMNE